MKRLSQAETLALIARAQAGDGRAEDELLRANEGLVQHFVRRVQPKAETFDRDDLLQEGRIGLLQAIRRFDFSRGVGFSTFAGVAIHRQLLDSLRNDPTIRRPQHRRDDPDLPRVLGSLDEPDEAGEGVPRAELLADPAGEDPFNAALARALVGPALAKLPQTQREAIILRYGLDGCEPRSVAAVARCLGVAKSGAGAREERALRRLRELLEG